MIKKNLKTLIITTVIILLPMIAGMFIWSELPDKIPMHWNIKGEVDGWSSKAFAVFGMPLVFAAVQWVCVFFMSVDPKNKNYSDKMKRLAFMIIPILSIGISVAIYASALGTKVLMDAIVPLILGFVFVVIGNYLPKCKQNYTIGIKIPWTLNDEENWNKTHRLAGWVWVIGGVITMLFALLRFVLITLIAPLFMALIPVCYSYILYKKTVKKESDDENNE